MTPVGGATPAPSRAPALLLGLGLGLGGFVDGIVLHQVLQWHHLVSDVEAYPTTTVAGWRSTPWPTASSTSWSRRCWSWPGSRCTAVGWQH
jgi:hypothetical protein